MYAFRRVFPAERLSAVAEQVVRLVVVHLHVRHRDLVGGAVVSLAHLGEHLRDGSGNDAAVDVSLGAAGDGERFSGTRLPVREHRAVEPVQRARHDPGRDAVEHLVLTGVGGQHAVELKTERLALVVDVPGVRVARDLETNRLLRLWFFFRRRGKKRGKRKVRMNENECARWELGTGSAGVEGEWRDPSGRRREGAGAALETRARFRASASPSLCFSARLARLAGGRVSAVPTASRRMTTGRTVSSVTSGDALGVGFRRR